MKTRSYEDFDLAIEKAGGRYRARVLNSPDGTAPPAEFDLPFSNLELENFILRFGQTRRTMRNIGVAGETANRSLREFGTRLYSAIFSGPIADRLHGSLGIVGQQEDTGLRIRLRLSDAPELIDVPWEYLFDASAGRFLTLSVDTPVVRYLDLPGQVKPLAVQPPLRILVMVSSPAGYAELNVEQEWQKLKDAVADLESRGLVVLERLEKPTLSELQRQLRKEDIHIFHFIGHGGFDEAAQDGVLILEAEDGKARPTSGKYLGTLLHDEKSVQLAVLNACEGGRTSKQDPFAGVGQSLVQSGIPAVVAMQFEISDQAAITLAHEFYAALADSYPVDAALAEARKAIFAQDNPVEWGTPVLYMRSEDGRVFDVAAAETLAPAAKASEPRVLPAPTQGPTRAVSTPSSISGDSVSQWNTTAAQAAKAIGGSLGRMWRHALDAPVSFGMRIASWAALAALVAFFLPWLGVSWEKASGASMALSGDFMPELLFVILSPAVVLVLRLALAGREGVRLGIPLMLFGLVPLFILNGVLLERQSSSYGILLSVLVFLVILAGGMADLVLPANRADSTSLRFPPGHIVALVGAGLALFGALVGISMDGYNYQYALAIELLLTSSILVWLWALLGLRRGRLNWVDSAGAMLAAAVCVTGGLIYQGVWTGNVLAVVAMLGGSACMLIGVAVNFVLAGRQRSSEPRKRTIAGGYRVAILGQIIAALVWILTATSLVDSLSSAHGGEEGFLPLLALPLPIAAVMLLALRSKARGHIINTDTTGLLTLGVFVAVLCIVGGVIADAAYKSYRLFTLIAGVPGGISGALMVWGGLLNRRIARADKSEQEQKP